MQSARSIDSLVLRRAGLGTAVAGGIVVIVSAIVSGGLAALGAALGTILVLAFFLFAVAWGAQSAYHPAAHGLGVTLGV